jgi:hypothetical protein
VEICKDTLCKPSPLLIGLQLCTQHYNGTNAAVCSGIALAENKQEPKRCREVYQGISRSELLLKAWCIIGHVSITNQTPSCLVIEDKGLDELDKMRQACRDNDVDWKNRLGLATR